MSWYEPQDKIYIDKLKISTLLDLALILPNSYEDNFLSDRFESGKDVVLEVEIRSLQKTPRYLKVRFFSIKFKKEIDGIIFHPKPFHFKLFQIGDRVFIKGKIEINFGRVSIIQPKTVTNINTIETKYKSAIANKIIKELIKKYITLSRLMELGLNEKESKVLHSLHFPTHQFLQKKENGLNTLKFVEAYNYIIKLSSKKTRYKAQTVLDSNPNKFIESLPFRLTQDQQSAISDIRRDFISGFASKRVVMGDVGCGKTIVILASVVMAYPKRAILMAPTSILAQQIYQEAKKYLPPYIKTTLVTSKQKMQNLKEYDFIVGTHALLYRELPKCELIMVDEQHRFGVTQREMIKNLLSKQKSRRVHFLQFSATPIPRTLAMINSSLVDYSFIKEVPFKKDIKTLIIGREDFLKLIKHIENEIEKDHQIAIIYPLVEESESIGYQSIDEAKEYWQKRYKNVYVTYGRDREKDKTLKEFKDNGTILISTTVIEVGISLPRLTTVVVVGAERLGFATLHQIRGRVSRTGLKGYCFLYTNHKNSKRLREFSRVTSGFDIAELDLRFRQSGDIVEGKLQSGKAFRWIELENDAKIVASAKKRAERYSLLGIS